MEASLRGRSWLVALRSLILFVTFITVLGDQQVHSCFSQPLLTPADRQDRDLMLSHLSAGAGQSIQANLFNSFTSSVRRRKLQIDLHQELSHQSASI